MAGRRAEVLWRLDHDSAFFAEHAVTIVGPGGRLMPLRPKRAQLQFIRALEAQRDAGRPMRAIVLKARKLGFSTMGCAMIVQRATRRPNHHALIVGQDNDTAGELFAMARLMYNRLPVEIQPPLMIHREGRGEGYLHFGQRSRLRRSQGDLGLNSSIRIDNAKDTSAGRGLTIRSMHLTEVAFWPDPDKLVSLLNAVPEEPDTLVILESTANGFNHFQRRWEEAQAGESGYVAVFAPWHEEPDYRVALSAEEEQDFWERQYGRGEFGEDEPRLVEQFGCDAGQLVWRRRTIVDRCNSDLDRWNQEYPASPEDAFISTGKTRFALSHIKRVIGRVASGARPQEGVLRPVAERQRLLGSETVTVPTAAVWTPRAATGFGERHAWWRVWEHPRRESTLAAERRRLEAGEISVEQFDALAAEADGDGWIAPGQYVIGVDVSGGEENTSGQRAWHAIQVIDHRSLRQVAEYRSRVDSGELALEALLAALYWNEPWLAVETTGGWGIPVVKDWLWRRYGYRRLYKRVAPEEARDRPRMVLGWDTNRRTKPQLEAGAEELLREGTDGIRSSLLAGELLTYVRGPDGRSGPSDGKFSDLLMAWMIAQQVAREKPLLPARRRGQGRPLRYAQPRDSRTGY